MGGSGTGLDGMGLARYIRSMEAEQRKKKLVIQYGGEGKAIPLNDIYYMESRNHNIILYLKDGSMEYYAKIGDLEEELEGQFYRIHRGYLINLFHVEGYDKTEVRMANGVPCFVGGGFQGEKIKKGWHCGSAVYPCQYRDRIKGLAEAGEYGEIEDYIRRMDETMQELEYKYVTGNAVTDVIINDKCRRAEKAGIRFDADFRYGGEIPVFDMGIILNNLLDNAIEACEKLEPGKGFIRLSLKRKKQFLILYVENSFDGTGSVSKGSPLPPTTKQSILPGIITEHGIGLENVRDIAERYFGGVNIKVKGDVFHVTVMLQQGEVGEGK